MTPTIKIVIAIVPFLIAVAVGALYLQPAIDEMNAKGGQVEEKRKDKDDLVNKLSSEGKDQSRKNALTKEIDGLRAAVPKTPDLDLFNIDLEKMCKESEVDLISIQAPKTDGSDGSPPATSAQQAQSNLKNALKGTSGSGTADGKGGAAADDRPDLEEISRQIEVTGDYNGLMKLVHRLETYQRVIKITSLKEHVPKKENSAGKDKQVKLPDSAAPGDTDEVGDPKQLYMSMKVTAYYLP